MGTCLRNTRKVNSRVGGRDLKNVNKVRRQLFQGAGDQGSPSSAEGLAQAGDS